MPYRDRLSSRRMSAKILAPVLSVSLAASLAVGGLAVPFTPAATAQDRDELSLQTQIIGDFWKDVRPPLINHDNLGDDAEFYTAPADVDLQSTAPGTILRERTINYHVATVEIPVEVTQLLYATTNVHGEIEPNVTSVMHPPGGSDGNVIAYQSFYDSATPVDNPSRIIAGNMTTGGLITALDTAIIAPALLAGHPVVLADTEGADAHFAAGPGYGYAPLDSLRAATASSAPVGATDQIGLLGYSGGSIASNWAAIHLADYAPELEERVVGVAQGGMFVDPVSNLEYASDGILWSGVVGLALSALARTYRVDIDDYLTDYGRAVLTDVAELSIVEAFGRYPGLHWSEIARPEYPTPHDVPAISAILEELNMGNWDSPSVPMFIFQGAGGFIEGTPADPVYGPGDGIMVTNDVRSLARQYCEAGTSIEYREYPYLSHLIAAVPWLVEGYLWLEGRFNGHAATDNCATIPPGNEL